MIPELSIVIPVYNAEKTIEICIESVIKECSSINISYEIIAVNDGSTDSSLSILEVLSHKFDGIKVLTQDNAGPSAARNNGLANATGTYIGFIDSDDEWLPGKLKYQFDYLKSHSDIDLITCEHSVKTKYTEPTEITFKKEAFHNYFCTQTVIFKNKIKEIQFPIDMKHSEDMRFFISAMLKYKCFYLPGLVSKDINNKLNFGEGGLSGNLLMMEKGELSNIKFMLKNKKISFFTYFIAIHYSYAKYLRRVMIARKMKKK